MNLSRSTRVGLYALVAIYGFFGLLMFGAPSWAAPRLAWRVSEFVTMTIGAWFLGTVWLAFVSARRGVWPLAVSPIVYLAAFGIGETAVLVAFRDRVVLSHPLAWGYLLTLAATCAFAAVAALDGLSHRPVMVRIGRPLRKLDYVVIVGLVLFSGGYLGVGSLVAGASGLSKVKTVFPEDMSMFTLRAFGAYFLALGIGALPLLVSRGISNSLSHAYASFGFLVTITAASLINIGLFDFGNFPMQAGYIGAYLIVGIIVGFYLVRFGTGGPGGER